MNEDQNNSNWIISNVVAETVEEYKLDPTEIPLNDDAKDTALDYFKRIKENMTEIDGNSLKEYIRAGILTGRKFAQTGQLNALIELDFNVSVARNELELLKLGFNQIVSRKQIVEWAKSIDRAESKKIIFANVEQYTRMIPNDVVQKMLKAAPHCSGFVIIFTDYTGQHQKEVDKANAVVNKERDPIIFASFEPDTKKAKEILSVHDHLVVIGDWEDEYCDLTLDKMLKQMAADGIDPGLKEVSDEAIMTEAIQTVIDKPKSFFDKVKDFLGKW